MILSKLMHTHIGNCTDDVDFDQTDKFNQINIGYGSFNSLELIYFDKFLMSG